MIIPALQDRPVHCVYALFLMFGVAGAIAPSEEIETWFYTPASACCTASTAGTSAPPTAASCAAPEKPPTAVTPRARELGATLADVRRELQRAELTLQERRHGKA